MQKSRRKNQDKPEWLRPFCRPAPRNHFTSYSFISKAIPYCNSCWAVCSAQKIKWGILLFM